VRLESEMLERPIASVGETGNPQQIARFTCVVAWRKTLDALLGPAAGSVPIHPDSRQGL